jgi:hypothetical protein
MGAYVLFFKGKQSAQYLYLEGCVVMQNRKQVGACVLYDFFDSFLLGMK